MSAGGPQRRWVTAAGTILLVLGIAALVVVAWPHKWGGRFGTTVVVGHSMDGTYSTGDLLVTARRQDYRPGDIIVYTVDYEQARGTVVHRIVDERDGVFTTRGDGNTYTDPWEVTPDQIRGAPVLRMPLVGWALLTARTPIVLMLLTGALVTFILWPSKDETEEPDEEAEPVDGLAWARSPLWAQPGADGDETAPPPQGASWPLAPPEGAGTDAEGTSPPPQRTWWPFNPPSERRGRAGTPSAPEEQVPR